jgi:hypothetical protein
VPRAPTRQSRRVHAVARDGDVGGADGRDHGVGATIARAGLATGATWNGVRLSLESEAETRIMEAQKDLTERNLESQQRQISKFETSSLRRSSLPSVRYITHVPIATILHGCNHTIDETRCLIRLPTNPAGNPRNPDRTPTASRAPIHGSETQFPASKRARSWGSGVLTSDGHRARHLHRPSEQASPVVGKRSAHLGQPPRAPPSPVAAPPAPAIPLAPPPREVFFFLVSSLLGERDVVWWRGARWGTMAGWPGENMLLGARRGKDEIRWWARSMAESRGWGEDSRGGADRGDNLEWRSSKLGYRGRGTNQEG